MTFCKPCRFILAFCLLSAAGSAAAYEPASTASSGDGLYHVTMGAPGEIPLVAINGGPGLDHTYLANAPVWKDMSARRQIIFYDQRRSEEHTSELQSLMRISYAVFCLKNTSIFKY